MPPTESQLLHLREAMGVMCWASGVKHWPTPNNRDSVAYYLAECVRLRQDLERDQDFFRAATERLGW